MTDRPHPHDDPDHAVARRPQNLLTALFGEPISIYTRQQAIEDGIFVDVSAWAGTGPEGMLTGLLLPVAITRALLPLDLCLEIPSRIWERFRPFLAALRPPKVASRQTVIAETAHADRPYRPLAQHKRWIRPGYR